MAILRILLLEDSLLDTELIQAKLTEGGMACELVQVETRTDYQRALETNAFDLILSDYSLPAFDGISALEIARAMCPDVPFIFVSATLGEELAIESLKRGATDYVLKQRLDRLVPAVQRALRETKERIERQRAETALRELAAELERRVEERTAQLAQANESLREEIAERKRTEERLRLLESVAVTANDAIVITEAEPIDQPGPRIIYVNEAFTRMTGYSAKEVLRKTPRILQGPKSDRAVLDKIRAALKQWQPIVVELINYRKDGSEFWMEASIVPVANEQGGYTHWVGVQRDITERKQAEAALRLSDQILTQMPDAVLLTNLEATIEKWTGKAEEIFGYTAGEVLGKPVTFLMRPDTQATTTAKVMAAIGEVGTFSGEITCVRKDGSEVPIEVTAKTLYDREGNPLGFLSINRNITERKQAEQERAQLIREQAARLEAEAQGVKSAFLAEASTVLASSLDYEITLASVAKLAVPFMADWCTVDILEENQNIRRVAIAHLDPVKVELAWEVNRRYPDHFNAAVGLPRVLRTGQATVASEIQDSGLVAVAQDAEHLQMLREFGLKSCIVVPLLARGRTLGAITLITAESGRLYSPDELPLVQDLARRAAIAVDNARLYRETQAAQQIAEKTAERNASLQALTAALSETLSLTQVGEVVVNQGLTALNARAGLIALLTDQDKTLEVVWTVGYSQELLNTWSRFPISTAVPLTDAVKTKQPILLESREDWAEQYPNISASKHINPDYHAWAALPLIIEGRAIGAMGFSFLNAKTFSEEDCAFMLALAQQCAQAIERARAYAAERQARAEAEAANRMKDEFLATLSHELRTPLNAMLGWTQLLRTRKFDESKMVRALETIDRNTKSLAALIEDILDVSRIMTGKLNLSVAPCELVSVITAAVETVRPAAEAKTIQLECFLAPAAGPVWGDANRLQQVVWNLLSNAIKFTPKGGRVEVRLYRVDKFAGSSELQDGLNVEGGKVEGSNQSSNLPTDSEALLEQNFSSTEQPSNLQSANSYAQIQVIDTGKGISPDFLPHVFERFRQENSSTSRSYGGLGIGLAIVRYLVEQHGGTVQAFSRGEGMGATFTVQLPLWSSPSKSTPPSLVQPTVGRVASTDTPLAKEPTAIRGNPVSATWQNLEGGISTQPVKSAPSDSLRVLIVDDEADARELLSTILEQSGVQVIAAASAQEALHWLSQSQADVLVSDIGMPNVDGYTLMRQIRNLEAERGGHIPAVALTAYARESDRMAALEAGFQVHLAKPFDPDELVKLVAKLARVRLSNFKEL
ncbi:MAG TPA: PAS domain S-box protein [Microcoleaceae cyanobacterium]